MDQCWMKLLIVVSQVFLQNANCEYFTSVVALESLLRTKEVLVEALDDYLEMEAERLEKVKLYREEYKRLFQNETSDTKRIVTNPINAYLLIKRLTADWGMLKELINDSVTALDDALANYPAINFPTEEDLEGAADGLVRLQKIYELNTTDLSNGYILGKKGLQELSAGDCIEIGRQMFNKANYEYSTHWMKETLNKLEKESNKTASREEALESLAYSLYKKGNITEALRLTYELLKIVPDHPRAINNIDYYEHALSDENVVERDHDDIPTSVIEKYQKMSKRLCRGEKILTAPEESKLKCYHFYGSNLHFIFTPLKVEELLLDPQMLLYHQFLTDKEIDTIISLAQPELRRATVGTGGEHESFSSNRISKIAWLWDEEDTTIQKISRRIESATGLTLSTAEKLQVLNYGIGGHYEAHVDFASRGEFSLFRKKIGDRMATWMNYMSDVEAGGATVFPEVGISVKPEKGAAVLWFNLLKNGTGDVRTRHTACPVLLGSKWVSNKWIHERGQEFIRKCGLKNE